MKYNYMVKDFNGAKIALLTADDQVLVYLRDDKPGLYMANKWDLPGGGKEGSETAFDTIRREVQEEFGFELKRKQIIHEADYPSERFPDTISKFFVGKIDQEQQHSISFGDEGQHYKFIPIQEFLSLPNAIIHLQERLRDFLTINQ